MEFEYSIWLARTIVIAIILTVIYVIAAYPLQKYRKKYITAKERQDHIQEAVTRINTTLLEMGMSHRNIADFWEESFAEAEIRHNLPPCICKDVNECETWCRAKARFTLNPPENN